MTESKLVAFPGRRPIPKSVRFAVFKRDAFTCQYCGAKAPDVILNVDHIKPVADGGENDIINLITSCFSCNSGKGAEPLDENSAIEKQRKQLEELTERRNQLEMMLQWREGLRDLEDDFVQAIQSEFLRYAPFTANETGLRDIKKWLKKYGLPELLTVIGTSFTQYLHVDDKGNVTSESWNKAFHMVPKIAEAERRGGIPPDLMRLFYIRGILRRRMRYVDERNVMSLLKRAVEAGSDADSLQHLAKHSRNWTDFSTAINDFLAAEEGK